VATRKNVNVAVAANVTTQARLKLYVYLSKLGKSVLYSDTDSVIYIQNVDEPPKLETWHYMDYLVDELEEFGSCCYIEEFVSGGPQNYAFSVFFPSTGKWQTKYKMKGITLNYENSKFVNFTSHDPEDDTPLHVHNPRKFKRKHGGVVVSEPEKWVQGFFKKLQLMDDSNSFPYGCD